MPVVAPASGGVRGRGPQPRPGTARPTAAVPEPRPEPPPEHDEEPEDDALDDADHDVARRPRKRRRRVVVLLAAVLLFGAVARAGSTPTSPGSPSPTSRDRAPATS
ncbi:hypothetical protein BJF90_27315 [Pseudonocardia sp. CNS-004]|nr:hypothetical protein BJF90_27315 [Pseudonocardia sp. CNS-004]